MSRNTPDQTRKIVLGALALAILVMVGLFISKKWSETSDAEKAFTREAQRSEDRTRRLKEEMGKSN
jgi:FtsZ-interacting cell division protein ZipA